MIFSVPLLILLTAAVCDQDRSDLTGRVMTESGAPIAGATVHIYQAFAGRGPKRVLLSDCAECTKSARTRVDGAFTLPSVDRERFYDLLVTLDGHPAHLVRDASARMDDALAITLQEPRKAACMLRGRVCDANGTAIPLAIIRVKAWQKGQGGNFGASQWIDGLAASDGDGAFQIQAAKEIDGLLLDVRARNAAPRLTEFLKTGPESHRIVLRTGAMISGVVQENGRPASGILLGIVQKDKSASRFVGRFLTETDHHGRFSFAHLPPDEEYYLFGLMRGQKAPDLGTVASRSVLSGLDGTALDIGGLVIGPSARLRGRVQLAGGGALPAGAWICIAREHAWDNIILDLAPDGIFSFAGLPRELVSASVRVPGFHLSKKNASFDEHYNRLLGILDREDAQLTIAMDRGPDRKLHFHGMASDAVQAIYRRTEMLRRTSLRGFGGDERPSSDAENQ